MKEDNRSTPAGETVNKRKVNKWSIYISLGFIVVGLIWYGVNIGLIPASLIQEQAGPIILVIIGILILISSVSR